jgi:hypothetical protein
MGGLTLAGLFLVAVGLWFLAAGVFDPDWLWQWYSTSRSRKVGFLPALLGRAGLRVFHAGWGLFVALVGVLLLAGGDIPAIFLRPK